MEEIVFFRRDFEEPAPETDEMPSEKTGPGRLFEILQAECGNLIKVNLLFLLCCLPIITIPLALQAMNQVIRAMVQDQPVRGLTHFRDAIRQRPGRAYAAFFLVAVPLFLSGYGAAFYLRYAGERPVLFLPFMFCSTIFLVTLLASTYLYGILSTGMALPAALRLALTLGIGRPLRALLAILFGYGLVIAAVLAFPLSFIYLLLIGFSLPCLLANFFVRTILRQYCGEEPQ